MNKIYRHTYKQVHTISKKDFLYLKYPETIYLDFGHELPALTLVRFGKNGGLFVKTEIVSFIIEYLCIRIQLTATLIMIVK